MKVLIASPWGERLGGSENVLWTLLRHIDRERIDPIVMLLAEGPFGEEIADAGFRTVIHPTHRLRKGGRWIRTTRAVRELIVRERPDVLVGWGPKPQLYLSPAASSTGLLARLVWMVHELPAHVVHRAAIGLPAAGIVCPSQFVAAAVGRLRPHRRTVVIHPGIETAPPASQAETMRLRRELALPEGRTILGMVARLAPIKGQHRLLEALADVRGRGHDCHALLVGGNAHDLAPGYERHLRALCARLRIEDAVTFAGQVADAGPYYGLMDFFVSAAPDEAFGVAVVEAMTAGIPVVALSVGGPSEIVEDDRSGILTPLNALADGIVRVACDPALRARLAAGAIDRAATTFTAARMADEWGTQLERLGRRPGGK